MNKAFFCECKKMKGKLLFLLLPVYAFLCAWMFWQLHDPDEVLRPIGYSYTTSGLLLLNSIFLPLVAAVMASRLMDVENRGDTYKLLYTMQKRSALFWGKLALAALHLSAFFLAEIGAVCAMGTNFGFTEAFPVKDYAQLFCVSLLVTLLLVILQLFFSLRFENQLYPLFIGLIGCFISLFANFFPPDALPMRFLPWCYYLVGTSSVVRYETGTRLMRCLYVPFDATGFVLLLLWLAAALIAVRTYFIRKEL